MGDNNLKIYTLSIPPSAEEPFLHPIRHQSIIRAFEEGKQAHPVLNSLGEVDLCILLPLEENFEEFPEKNEELSLRIGKDTNTIYVDLYYDGELFCVFSFDVNNQLDLQCLRVMVEEKMANVYFICFLDDYYVCYGFKTITLPKVFSYDLSRYLAGKSPLLLPRFNRVSYSDEFISGEMLLSNAWGFCLDYSSILARQGDQDYAEEIIFLHILNGLACLQKSRSKKIAEDRLVLWVGRRLGLDDNNQPKDLFIVYLSGTSLTESKAKATAVKILDNSFKELPEYLGAKYLPPLAQEAVPMVVLLNRSLYRLDLGERFYSLSRQLFAEHYLPYQGYISYYDKLFSLQEDEASRNIVYDLWLKRWEQGYDEDGQLPFSEIEKLIECGKKQDLTRIFMLLAKVPESEIDHLIVSICEIYQRKAEPYLLAGLAASSRVLQEASLLGLGILESTQAIPSLLRLIRQGHKSQHIWDTFLMIGDPAVQALADLLQEHTPHIRNKALETLKSIGSPTALETIRSLEK